MTRERATATLVAMSAVGHLCDILANASGVRLLGQMRSQGSEVRTTRLTRRSCVRNAHLIFGIRFLGLRQRFGLIRQPAGQIS